MRDNKTEQQEGQKHTWDPLLKHVILKNASFLCFGLCHDTNLFRFPSLSFRLHGQCWFHKHPTGPFTPKSMLAVLITYFKCHSCLSFRKSAAPCLKVKPFKSSKLANSKISTQIQNWRFLFSCMLNRKISFYYFLLLLSLLSKILALYLHHSFLLMHQSENAVVWHETIWHSLQINECSTPKCIASHLLIFLFQSF